MLTILIGILEQGFIYGILALGIYITFKILDFPDLSVDGTFPLGGAITAALITQGVNPWLTLPLSFIAGSFAGIITGIIHVKLKVRDMLSGMIVMTGLYSINLRIAGKANLPIFSKETIFDNEVLSRLPQEVKPFLVVIISFIILIIMKILLDHYLNTKSGYLLSAVGDNATFVTSLGKDKGTIRIVGLSIANGYVGLAGSIYAQRNGFFEISTGTGTMMMGLASVIMGLKLFQNLPRVKKTGAVIFGSIVYQGSVAIAISLGMPASDLKLITAILFLIVLVISNSEKKKKLKSYDE